MLVLLLLACWPRGESAALPVQLPAIGVANTAGADGGCDNVQGWDTGCAP
jgi:hypothetical protein